MPSNLLDNSFVCSKNYKARRKPKTRNARMVHPERKRRKRKQAKIPLHVKLPPKRIREKFLIIYELEGCQKAVDFLTEHYGVRRMKTLLDGKKVGKKKSNSWVACYSKNNAYFTKKGLTKRIVLHELYHHLIESNGLELPLKLEEKEANIFASESLMRAKKNFDKK